MGHYASGGIGADDSVRLTFENPVHLSTIGPVNLSDAVPRFLTVSIDVSLQGPGRAARAVRANPGGWKLCCAATPRDFAVDFEVAPSCAALGDGASLSAVPLPRGGGVPTSKPAVWELEAWLEAAPGSDVAPQRRIMGLSSITVTS